MAKRQRTAETLPVDAIDLPRDVMLEIILEALGNAENRAEAAEKRSAGRRRRRRRRRNGTASANVAGRLLAWDLGMP